ncbi:MarR family winged helix-turn-helix transcriptional regulator [Limosilactobacillus reuteri]
MKTRWAYQLELGDHFHLRNASVTSMVKNLERDGYIIRKADQESARIKRIFLTRKGVKKRLMRLKKYLIKLICRLLAASMKRDIDAIVKGMTTINSNLKK